MSGLKELGRNFYSQFAKKENPQKGILVFVVPQSNKEIIDFVVDQMADTLGDRCLIRSY
jgi:hypothetical protein